MTSHTEGWREFEVDFQADRGFTVGLIALTNDSAIQPDVCTFLAGTGTRLQTSRIESPPELDVAGLNGLLPRISAAAAKLLPGNKLDVVAFGCTSAAMALGPKRIAQEVRKAHPAMQVTNPVSAALKAFEAFGVTRIALLTPYIGEVNRLVEEYLASQGVEIVSKGFFPVRNNDERSWVSRQAFLNAARALADAPGVDLLFVSCTALSTSAVVQELERETALPVVTSNQALSWDSLRLAGNRTRAEDRGSLLRI